MSVLNVWQINLDLILSKPTLHFHFWEYDPSTNLWTQKADFGEIGRHGPAGFSIGSKGYMGMGGLPTNVNWWEYDDFWEYIPGQ